MATLDLTNLITESLGMADSYAANAGEIADITAQGSQIAVGRAEAAKVAGNAAATMTEAELLAKAQIEAINKSIAARLGTDASNAGWIIGKVADEVAVLDQELAQHTEAIRVKESINFIDNPFGYILAQATVNTDIANFNAAATLRNNAENKAAMAAKRTTEAYQANASLSTAVSQAYIDAAKIVSAHKFNAEAQDAAQQALRWNLEGITLAANAGRDRLQVLYSANSAQMQERQYQNELERLRMQKAEFNLRAAAAREKTDEDSLILKYIQKGFFNLNGVQMGGARAKDALILFKAKEPKVMKFFTSGMESYSISPDGAKSVISLSPFDASTLIAQNEVHKLPDAQLQVGAKLVEWRREFESTPVQSQMQLDRKDKTSVERAFNSFVEQKKKLELTNTRPDSVFAPASVKQVAAVNPTVQSLPVWKTVLAPAVNAGVDVNDPNVAFGMVMNAVAEGKLSYQDAVDVSLIYQAGLDLNNQSRNFIAMGLGPVKTYNTSVKLPYQMGRTNINLADSRAVATALNKSEAARMSSNGALRTGASGLPAWNIR